MNKKLFASTRSRAVLITLFIIALMGAGAWYFLQRSIEEEEEAESVENILPAPPTEVELPAMENKAFSC